MHTSLTVALVASLLAFGSTDPTPLPEPDPTDLPPTVILRAGDLTPTHTPAYCQDGHAMYPVIQAPTPDGIEWAETRGEPSSMLWLTAVPLPGTVIRGDATFGPFDMTLLHDEDCALPEPIAEVGEADHHAPAQVVVKHTINDATVDLLPGELG